MKAVRLGEHARLIRGITFKPQDKCDPHDEGAVVCMRTKNVQSTLDGSDLIAIPMSLVKNIEKMISIGDILVSSANSWNLVGKCCQVRELQFPSTAGGFISILRPKTDKLDAGYLYRWFSSEKIQNKVRSFGNQTTNISNLDHKRTLNLQIPLPPIAEQKRIAAILDAADALRAKRRETLAQLDTLLQSTFLDMFGDPVTNPMGWEVQPLKELGQVQTGSTPPSKLEGMFGGEVPFVTPGDLKDTWTNSSRTVTIAGAKKSRTVQRGATFVCCIGATIGKMGKAEKFSAFNQQINTVTWGPRIDDGFGLEMMKFFKEKIATDGASTTLPILKKSLFEKIIVLAPPLPLQRRFATIVESVEQQKTRLRAHLTELDILFASLQDRAFKGAL